MIFGNPGPDGSVELRFTVCGYRGERRPEQMREYPTHYHPLDEHVPRMRSLPDSTTVSVAERFADFSTAMPSTGQAPRCG